MAAKALLKAAMRSFLNESTSTLIPALGDITDEIMDDITVSLYFNFSLFLFLIRKILIFL